MARTDTPIANRIDLGATISTWPLSPHTRSTKSLGTAITRAVDPTVTITSGLQVSPDGGKTWVVWCSVTDQGGVKTLGGRPVTTASLECTPPPAGTLTRSFAYTNGKVSKADVSIREDT